MKLEAEKLFCVKGEHGLCHWTVQHYAIDARSRFIREFGGSWRGAQKLGYRVVPVALVCIDASGGEVKG